MKMKHGFTLIEMLVVVLIIGILSAIALPWFQRAIIRAKYHTLALPAKSVWEGQEAYYLIHNRYASTAGELDMTVPSTNEVVLEMQNTENAAYVKASRPGFENNYVVYQQHSALFPGQTFCEALIDNTNANWLCETSLHGTLVAGASQTEGYNAYVINGAAVTEEGD